MTYHHTITALSILGLGLLAPSLALAREPAAVPSSPSPSTEAFRGTHGFVGLTGMGGPMWGHVNLGTSWLFSGWTSGTGGQLLAALKGGVLLGRTELGVEVAPFTYASVGAKEAIAQLEAHGYTGYHLRLSDKLSWPLRAGLGMVTGNTYGTVWLHSRLDLVGLSIPYGSWLVDLHLPSFRVTNTLAQRGISDQVILAWLFGASVALLP